MRFGTIFLGSAALVGLAATAGWAYRSELWHIPNLTDFPVSEQKLDAFFEIDEPTEVTLSPKPPARFPVRHAGFTETRRPNLELDTTVDGAVTPVGATANVPVKRQLLGQDAGTQDAGTKETSSIPKAIGGVSATSENEETAGLNESAMAVDFVQRAQEALAQRKTIQAEIYEVARIGRQPFRANGLYAGTGFRLHLELDLQLRGDERGHLLEICDGETLWSSSEMLGIRQNTRRDVRQILNAGVAGNSRETLMLADLGLGGLPGLMASVQRCMLFDAIREEQGSDHSLIVVQAHWKEEFLSQWFPNARPETLNFLPTLLRISFDPETMFPQRFLYLRREQEKASVTLKPLLLLEFRNVRLDQSVDESLFNFVPPDGVIPEDITKQYLDRIIKAGHLLESSQDEASAAGKSKK